MAAADTLSLTNFILLEIPLFIILIGCLVMAVKEGKKTI